MTVQLWFYPSWSQMICDQGESTVVGNCFCVYRSTGECPLVFNSLQVEIHAADCGSLTCRIKLNCGTSMNHDYNRLQQSCTEHS